MARSFDRRCATAARVLEDKADHQRREVGARLCRQCFPRRDRPWRAAWRRSEQIGLPHRSRPIAAAVSHRTLSDSASESRRVRPKPWLRASERSGRTSCGYRSARPATLATHPVPQQALPPAALACRTPDRTSRQGVPDTDRVAARAGSSGKHPRHPSLSPPRCGQLAPPTDAKDTRLSVPQSRGCSVVSFYNDVHPHSRLAYHSPREYIRAQSQPAVCPV